MIVAVIMKAVEAKKTMLQLKKLVKIVMKAAEMEVMKVRMEKIKTQKGKLMKNQKK